MVKKSMAAIASRWFLRNAIQRFAGSGFRGTFLVQRSTVRSETSKPSIFNSPWIRGASQVRFSATMRKMSSCNSLLTHFLPARFRCRESHVQNNLNPARCERPTVSGWMKINARFHPGQSRRNITQNNLSEARIRGCGCLRFKTASCCRRARFSKSRSWRERKNRIASAARSLSRRNMRSVLHAHKAR